MNTPLKTIGDLAQVIAGFSPKPDERKKHGTYLLLGGRNIKNGELVKTDADSYVDDISRGSFRRAIAHPGDIIISTLFDRRKLYTFTESDPIAVVNSSCAIIRSRETGDYIASYLRTMEGEKDFLDKATKATGGAFIPRLSIADLSAIQVPILPVAKLSRFGDARLAKSSKTDLIAMKKDLESKDAEIESLKAKHAEMERFYQDRLKAVESRIETNDLASRITNGETATLEFKSSLRWNVHKKEFDCEIENAVLKTIVAFCNTKGGELLIGIADDGSILGVEHDRFPNSDKFQLHLGNLLQNRIVPNLANLIEYKMVTMNDKSICHVTCRSSTKEIWLRPDKNSPEHFFIRFGPSSKELTPREAVEYIKDHFEKMKDKSPTRESSDQ